MEGLRLVVCHLGGGSSITAVRDGRSVDTTMGFSPLEGVPMTTRSGSVDPGALLFVQREHGLDADETERVLNHESGLRALAGGSGEMIELESRARDGDPDASLALDVFSYRVAGAVAAMAVAAGGLDALVFTAGIGEGSALVRERVCALLDLLGVAARRRAQQQRQLRTATSQPTSRRCGSSSYALAKSSLLRVPYEASSPRTNRILGVGPPGLEPSR